MGYCMLHQLISSIFRHCLQTCTMAFRVQKVESFLIGRTLDAVPVRSGEIITGVLHGNGSTTLYDGRQKIVLQPDDRIIYTYLCD